MSLLPRHRGARKTAKLNGYQNQRVRSVFALFAELISLLLNKFPCRMHGHWRDRRTQDAGILP